ncbi:MAG TPA: radical SAM family heme chaperone HemW [Balneolales bacterium]|nr:radical SAM family heme chaperone HemW [Balneolales bacterium]
MSGLYIHIPFCKQACSYCDFYFITKKGQLQPYINSLINEISSYKDTSYSEETVETIYFGGGTPSLLHPNDLKKMLHAISNVFDMGDIREITLEMNPDDVTSDYLKAIKDLGINRASMGVQSFQPSLLEFMHRAHNRVEALKSLELLSKADFKTYTVDLIYGNPGQTLEQLEQDLDLLLTFNPPHVSAYALTIEPRTRLGKLKQLGRISPLEDERVNQHLDLLVEKLHQNGIERYEISNYSVPGQEAIHNSNYWEHNNYLGLGPAAHSFWWKTQNGKAIRWQNKADFKNYVEQGTGLKTGMEELDLKSLAEERIMLGLRTVKGLLEYELKNIYHYHFSDHQKQYLAYLIEQEFLKRGEPLRLTPKGMKLADRITLEIISRF